MINSQTTIQKPLKREIEKGDIFWADLSFITGINSLQKGIRPFIPFANGMCLKNSSVITGILVTSVQTKSKLPTHVALEAGYCGLEKDSVVLCEQIISLPTKNLLGYIGHIEEREMEKIENAVKIQLQIDKPNNMKNFPVPQKHQMEAFDITRVQIIKRGIESLERVLMENSINNITNILNDIQGLVDELKNYCDKFNVNYSLYYKSRLHAINNEKIRMCI